MRKITLVIFLLGAWFSVYSKSFFHENVTKNSLYCLKSLSDDQIENTPSTFRNTYPANISGSTVSLVSGNPLTAGTTGVLEFQVHNTSPDDEWISDIQLTLPSGWTTVCNSQDPQDSGGNAINKTCSVSGNVVTYADAGGDIRGSRTWNFTIDVTPPSNTASGNYDFNFMLTGDGFGSAPHTASGSQTGAITVQASGGIPVGNINCTAGTSEITGTVFEDYNYNGTYNSGESLGIEGMSVTATDSLNNSFTAVSNAIGEYSFPGLISGRTYRIEFLVPDSLLWASSTFYGGDNGTKVQFIKPGNCANLGFTSADSYCEANPKAVTTCFVDGNPLGGGTSGQGDVIVAYPFSSSGTGNSGNEYLAINSQIGSVWAIAYRSQTSVLYAGAMMKRHAGFGPLGIGGIYAIDYSNPSSPVASNWLDLNSITAVGTNPRSYTLPASAGTGSPDPAGFDPVGKIGIGDIALSSNEDTMYVLNLNNNGSLLKIDIQSKSLISSTPIGNPGCGNAGDVRPWALEIHKNKVHIGLICSGENAGASDLQFFVQRLDNSGWTTILNEPLTYNKGKVHSGITTTDCDNWEVWTSSFSGIHFGGSSTAGPRWCRPQPILSDMEFGEDGSLYLGFMDRTGHQTGYLQRNTADTETGNGYIGGDILKAYNNNGTLVLESNGVSGPDTGCGFGNNQGPGGGEFFCNDLYSTIHQETSLGGLGYLQGSQTIVVNTMDPLNIFSGGTSWMDVNDGSRTQAYQVYISNGGSGTGTFGKAAGLGDLELICQPAPIEIGNYVWKDTNGDGIQDAGEPPLEDIRMELYSADGTLLAIDSTNSLGHYFFSGNGIDNADWQTADDTLMANTSYYIVAGGNGQFSSNMLNYAGETLQLTADSTGNSANKHSIDSDGTIAVGIDPDFDGEPYTKITTGSIGEVDHSFDFGFKPAANCSTINSLVSNRIICSGDNVDSLAFLTTHSNPDSIAFVYFDSKQTDSIAIYSLGTSIDTLQISPGNDTVRITDIGGFTNSGSTPDTFYVYGIVQPAPAAITCRPYSEILVIVNPLPDLAPTLGEVCIGSSVSLTGLVSDNFNLPGSFSYYNSLSDAQTETNALISTDVSPVVSTTYYARKNTTDGCKSIAAIPVTVNEVPDISTRDTCVCANVSLNLSILVENENLESGILSYHPTAADAVGNSNSFGAVVTPSDTTYYYVRKTSSTGCFDVDSILVNLCEFDLALKKTSLSPGTVIPGNNVTFEIKVYNQGDCDAGQIIIHDYIPTGLALNDSNWDNSTNPQIAADTIAALAAGDSTSLQISLQVNLGVTGTLVNNAEIVSATGGTDEDSPLSNLNDGSSNELASDNDINDNGPMTPGSSDNPTDEDDYDPAQITVECPPSICLPVTIED